MKKTVIVNDKMQKDYQYYLTETMGQNFDDDFKPELTPKEMLELGVFGGRYMNDCLDEFPPDWFEGAKMVVQKDHKVNYFQIDASLPLKEWQRKGWIYKDDPRGWFQWYCRYYMGRRGLDDSRQIKRWKAFVRHKKAVQANCHARDLGCRRKQRQALLHWAYDSRKI